MGEDEARDGDAAGRRNRSIRRAVCTSFASKAGTALLQLVSIPIAIRVLGREEFGLYAGLSMIITMVMLLEIGVGPALTHGLSSAVARGDRDGERRYYSTSFFMMAVLAVVGACVLGTAIALLSPAVIFGPEFAQHEETVRPALWLGAGLITLVFFLSHTERSREGLLEVGHNNLWGAVGNLIAAAGVGIGVWFFPSINFLLLAVFGPQVLAKLANTIHLWLRRPHLVPRLALFRGGLAVSLLKDGLAFSAAYSVVGVVEYNLAANLVGRVGGPGAVAVFSVLLTLCISALGFVIMFTTPTWPAVVDAYARGDIGWVRRAAKHLYMLAGAIGLAVLVGLAAVGPIALPLWLGDEFADVGRLTLVAFGCYFLMHVWRHVNHVLLIGVGKVSQMARVQLFESAVMLLPVWFGMRTFGVAGAFGAMALTIALLTGWILPAVFQRAVANADAGDPDSDAVQPAGERGAFAEC